MLERVASARERHVHFDWCSNVSRDQADAERHARKDYIDSCR